MKIKKIFFDVDTQRDFMDENGALYVPGAKSIRGNLRKLTEYACENSIAVLGSVDKHFATEEYKEREKELQRNGGPFPDHCMDGTIGNYKIWETTLKNEDARLQYGGPVGDSTIHPHYLDNTVSAFWLRLAITGGKQTRLYFEKQTYDVFSNPATESFLKKAGVEEAVVYGVATDYCVKAAALGMRRLGIEVYLVEDAIKGVSEETTKKALEEMKNAGVKFVTTQQILEKKLEE